MGRKFFVAGHLLVPFGCPKWKIDDIGVAGVTTKGTYFECETPVAYIDTTKGAPLRLVRIRNLFPEKLPVDIDDPQAGLCAIRDWLKTKTETQTDSERRFLDLYTQFIEEAVRPHAWDRNRPRNDPNWAFQALMPLPQAHLYLDDPLAESSSYLPTRMVKVDFAFWTGKRFVAVEIDGKSHIGSEDHIVRDRMLQRAGVQVIHIVNEELLKHGTKVVTQLLPTEVIAFHKGVDEKYLHNPMRFHYTDDDDDIPF